MIHLSQRPGTANDETSANASYGTMAQANIAAHVSQFAATVSSDGVQITDVRGTSTGWSLYAYPTVLVSTKGYDLYGATITFSGGTVANEQLSPLGGRVNSAISMVCSCH